MARRELGEKRLGGLRRLGHGRADAQDGRVDLLREARRLPERCIRSQIDDLPSVCVQEHRNRQKAGLVPFTRSAAEHDPPSRASESAVQQAAHLAAENLGQLVLLSHGGLAVLPELAHPPEGRRDDLGHGLARRKEGEGLLDGADDAWWVRDHGTGDELFDKSLGVEPRGVGVPAEQARSLPDPVPLLEPGLQPLDSRHVALGVATMRPGGALGVQHPVALLPLPERRGGDSGPACDCLDVHVPATG